MSKKGCCLFSAGLFLVFGLCVTIGTILPLFGEEPGSQQQAQDTNLTIFTPTTFEVSIFPDSQSDQGDMSEELPIPVAYAIVQVPKADIYSGPGENFDVVITVHKGDELPVFGITEDNKWIQVLDNSSWIDVSMVGFTFQSSAFLDSLTSTPQPQEPIPPTATPSITPKPTPAPDIIIDVTLIINKTVTEVETILGTATYVTPNDDNDDILAGGEYRDYEIGKYGFFVSFDRNGNAKGFQIMDGLSDEDYSLDDWGLLLPRFGLVIQSPPDKSAPAALYWYDYQGYGIAVAAENMNGTPVWTVQIEDAGVFMK